MYVCMYVYIYIYIYHVHTYTPISAPGNLGQPGGAVTFPCSHFASWEYVRQA